MLVYYFVPFIVSNRYLLFRDSNGHNSVTVQNRTHVYMNFFDHKDLGNHLLQLCPKVVKHPVYVMSWSAPNTQGKILGARLCWCRYWKRRSVTNAGWVLFPQILERLAWVRWLTVRIYVHAQSETQHHGIKSMFCGWLWVSQRCQSTLKRKSSNLLLPNMILEKQRWIFIHLLVI